MPCPRRWILGFSSMLLAMVLIAPASSPRDAAAATPSIRLSSSSGNIASNVTVSYRGFTKNRAVRIKWDGTTIVTATTSAAGDGATVIAVPNGVKGAHTVKVVMGEVSAAATYSIRPQIRMSPASVTVGRTISTSFRGYAAGESVKVTLDGATTALATVRMSSTGDGTARFPVPATPGGSHKLYGKGGTGSSDSVTFQVVPSIALIPASGEPGANIRVHLRGYAQGERVEIQFRYPDQTASLGFATASSTGSVNTTFTVPRKATPGMYAVIARGYGVSVTETSFQVT
jgi:hypothetical protein